jgi:hypothetical protein
MVGAQVVAVAVILLLAVASGAGEPPTLGVMKVSELSEWLLANGAAQRQIDACLDADDPRAAALALAEQALAVQGAPRRAHPLLAAA